MQSAYLVSPKSRNAKTGRILVTSSDQESCAPTCPLAAGKCYAKYSYMGKLWTRLTAALPGDDIANGNAVVKARAWQDLIDTIKALPDGALWRHNQMGDLAHYRGKINKSKLRQLIRANRGKRGFTYTHHAPSPNNLAIIRESNEQGFTVNLSGNNPSHADMLASTGLPVVTVLPADQQANSVTPQGRKIVVCPATQRDNVTCATCKLCSIAKRNFIVGFPAHGTGKNKE